MAYIKDLGAAPTDPNSWRVVTLDFENREYVWFKLDLTIDLIIRATNAPAGSEGILFTKQTQAWNPPQDWQVYWVPEQFKWPSGVKGQPTRVLGARDVFSFAVLEAVDANTNNGLILSDYRRDLR